MTDLPTDTELELAALADGSLAPERRERALERVGGSRELQAALAEQRRMVELTAAAQPAAPASLHRRVEAMIPPARPRRSFAMRRVGFAAAAAAIALAAMVMAIDLSAGGSSGLNVQQAAALTLSTATMPAPVESRTDRAQLAVAVGGVPFPYWKERFGWRSSGARSDRLAGRSVTTIFYANGAGRRIGYAIVSGPAPATHGGTLVRRWGVTYRLLSHDGATVVTWRRGGHLCVVSGHDVSAHTLLNLASWGSEKPHTA
ncbi:MAG TPA: hypothetical protein VK781_11050 [Solirubrobacteraceae bacterium]|jgi:hypothetical protein|nr:hypothetical protein [Solirubrobacteraceae bacterium]